MSQSIDNKNLVPLTYEEKNGQLFLRQKETLDMFFERGAISQEQHNRSFQDLIEKMCMKEEGENNKVL